MPISPFTLARLLGGLASCLAVGTVCAQMIGPVSLPGPSVPVSGLPTGTLQVVGNSLSALLVSAGVALALGYWKERNTAGKLTEVQKLYDEERAARKAMEVEVTNNRNRISELESTHAAERGATLTKLTIVSDNLVYITKKYIAVMNAALVRENFLKRGKSVTLPVADTPPVPTGPMVLVVEDSPDALQTLMNLLEHYNFRTAGASTLEEGLAKLVEIEPDAILLDLMLPGGDGAEILRRVRAEGRSTRVVITTGRPLDQLGYVRELNPDAILTKPLDFETRLLPALRGEVVP